MNSGLLLTPRALAKPTEHRLKALGQLNVANRLQCIDNNVEFSRADNQVDAIAIDIEQRLTGIARVFGWHGGRELSRPTMRTRLRGG